MKERLIAPVPEAQAYLGGISRTQLYHLIDQGVITRVNIGRRAFITRASMDAYVGRLAGGDAA